MQRIMHLRNKASKLLSFENLSTLDTTMENYLNEASNKVIKLNYLANLDSKIYL